MDLRASVTALRERQELNSKLGSTQNVIKPGDIVLVHADNKKRLYWDLTVVESLIIGKDGLACAANIKTRSAGTNRPITKLYPLETSTGGHGGEIDKNTINAGNTTLDNARPKRQAAQHGMDKIKLWLND